MMLATRLSDRLRTSVFVAGGLLGMTLVASPVPADDSARTSSQPVFAVPAVMNEAVMSSADSRSDSFSTAFRSYTRRISLLIDNTGKAQRDDWPVSLAVKEIRGSAPDFDPDQCAVVAPQRSGGRRQVPHQVDQISPKAGREISFLIDAPKNEAVTYYLYYAPSRVEKTAFPMKTGTAEDWVPPNIGWESSRCAYRAYWGQFDFFGKKTEQLIYGDIGPRAYHEEVEWGIDALNVAKAAGLGGLTLYEGDQAWPVRNPAGKGKVDFSKRVLVRGGPVRCAIEIGAKNVVPARPALSVRMVCLIYAERQETEIRATVTGGEGEVVLAPGIVKLPRERTFADPSTGCYGVWGWQQDVIGEIGMGLIVSPKSVIDLRDEPDERRVRCRAAGGELLYWVIGDWARGRPRPAAPNLETWRGELQSLARLLLDDVKVRIRPSEPAR